MLCTSYVLFCAFVYLLLNLFNKSLGVVAGDERNVFVGAEILEKLH